MDIDVEKPQEESAEVNGQEIKNPQVQVNIDQVVPVADAKVETVKVSKTALYDVIYALMLGRVNHYVGAGAYRALSQLYSISGDKLAAKMAEIKEHKYNAMKGQ